MRLRRGDVDAGVLSSVVNVSATLPAYILPFLGLWIRYARPPPDIKDTEQMKIDQTSASVSLCGFACEYRCARLRRTTGSWFGIFLVAAGVQFASAVVWWCCASTTPARKLLQRRLVMQELRERSWRMKARADMSQYGQRNGDDDV